MLRLGPGAVLEEFVMYLQSSLRPNAFPDHSWDHWLVLGHRGWRVVLA